VYPHFIVHKIFLNFTNDMQEGEFVSFKGK
jgi:hypothetical protein